MFTRQSPLIRSLAVAGAYFGFVIGAGYTSGQEVLQYFASQGWAMFLTVGVYLAVAVFLTPEFMRTSQRERFATADGIYKYYCGRVVGSFYDVFAHVFLFTSFVVMLSAMGATLEQFFALPTAVGIWATAAATCLVAILGFQRVVDILSRFGPVLILAMLAIAVVSIATSRTSFAEGVEAMQELEVISASNNWFMSAINYIGFSIFWAAPFLARYGKTIDDPKVAVRGQALGEIVLGAVTVVISIALIMNIRVIADTQVPILTIATQMHPWLGAVFALLMLLAIFSTAVPLLSLSVGRFAEDGTARSRIGLVVASVVAAFIASMLPFDQLVNYIYVANGYVGFVFMFFVVVTVIRRRMRGSRQAEPVAAAS